MKHFRLDLDDLSRLYGLDAPTISGTEFLSNEMDLWLDSETHQLLKAEFANVIQIEELDEDPFFADLEGGTWEISGSFEIFDINDPSIFIEPPI